MALRDSINLISKLTAVRMLNAAQVVISYYVSRITRKPLLLGRPISFAIEPTTSCNLRCPECPSGLRNFTRATGMLDKVLFKQVIDSVYRKTFYLTFYFQGEPYLNPDFLKMVKYASQKKMYVATSTNAHYLDDSNARATVESGLDKLIISMDGVTQESYEQYRIGGDLNKVIEGTKNILKWRKSIRSKTPYIVFQFVVFRHNEKEIAEIKKLGKKIGVDEVKIKSAQIYDYENGNKRIPYNKKYSRYKIAPISKENIYGRTYSPPSNTEKAGCWKMWNSTVITWDGNVIPCCFDKDANYKFGNLKEDSFDKVWQNKAYRKFRTSLLKSRSEIDICKNCSVGTKVWL